MIFYYFFNSTATSLKNQNKTTGAVFNNWSFRLQTSPYLFSNNIPLQKNMHKCPSPFSPKGLKQIGSPLINFKILSSKLLIENKNPLSNSKMQDLQSIAWLGKTHNKPCFASTKRLFKRNRALLSKSSQKDFPFFNRSFDKKRLKMLFSWYYANRGEAATFSLVETLQKLGFTYAMKAGISLGVDDLKVPPTKGESLTESVELLTYTKASVNSGNVTALEEFQQFVDTWHRTSENLKTSVVQNFNRGTFSFLKKSINTTTKGIYLEAMSSKKKDLFKSNGLMAEGGSYKQKQKSLAYYNTILNPVYMMAFSGARGNLSQVRQLVGMRGLMADPQGQLVEFPIQSNFREGLTVTEYMISCYGARKGLVDTALRTAAAGYLTRRLVDVSHHQIVRFVTCSTKNGILLSNEQSKKQQNKDNLLPSAWKVSPYSNFPDKKSKITGTTQKNKEEKEQFAPLVSCVGRVLARDIPGTAFRNQEIDISLASSPLLRKVYDTIGIFIRSPLTCKSETGICQLCYGWSVSANRLVGLGEAVGIIAAQSIGEPGTQLTMRTFHTGGVFSGDIMEECRAKHAGIVIFQNIYLGLLVRTAGGAIAFCLKTPAIFQIKGINESTTYTVSANTLLFVRQGEKVIVDSLLAQIPNLPAVEENTGESTKTIVSDLAGEVRQKATVNPELASIRILAGQECKQFYFFNPKKSGFATQGSQNQHSGTTSIFLEKQLICTNSLNNKAPILKNNNLRGKPEKISLQSNEQLLTFQKAKEKNSNLIKQSLVNLIWGAHRLGNNQTFSININGSNSEVVLGDQKPIKLSTSLEHYSFYSNNDFNSNLAYVTGLANSAEQVKQQINTGHYSAQNLIKINLLVDLRFFVASRMHQNKFQTFLNKNSNKTLNNKLTKLSQIELVMLDKTVKTKKLSHALLVLDKQKYKPQNQFINSEFYSQLIIYKTNLPTPGISLNDIKSTLKVSTTPFLDFVNVLQEQVKSNSKFYTTHRVHCEFLRLKDFFLSYKTPKQVPLSQSFLIKPSLDHLKVPKKVLVDIVKHLKNKESGQSFAKKLVYNKILIDKNFNLTKQFSTSNLLVIDKKKANGAIKKFEILTIWSNLTPFKMLNYAYLFWKLEDLVFFRSNFTKKTPMFSQLRGSINKRWWGNKSSTYLLYKPLIYKRSKGLELINFLKESTQTSLIKDFPRFIFKLFSRFNIENSLNNFQFCSKTQKASDLVCFNNFSNNTSKPRLKFQDSGEIFPLQGNTNLEEFKKKFRSFQIVSSLNSGLLIHQNRISYKIPLFCAYKNTNLSVDYINDVISTKEQLSFLRSELAVFTKQSFVEKNYSLGSYSTKSFLNPFIMGKLKGIIPNEVTVSNNTKNKLWEKGSKQNLQDSHSTLNSSLFRKTVIIKNTLIPQIGSFINTGDEIIRQCASAYCGQIIEKSPVGLTLRLTQNILYSNLRTRPAKININVKNGKWIEKGAPLVTLPYISNVTGDIVAGIPKIEQLFEARGEALDEVVEKIWTSIKYSIVPRSKAVRECFKEIGLYVVAAIQKVYSSQGVHIADKHLEVIIRQMTRRALIVDPGDTEFLPEEFVDLNTIECVNWTTYGDNATYRPRLIGITKASLTSNSFLSSASFQQTARVLERETILEKTDRLLGLKERVMMGALINAGTGELKTSVKLSDRSLAKSLSSKLLQRLNFFSRRKIEINKKSN